MQVFEAFRVRRPVCAAVIGLLFGPDVVMAYLGRGLMAIAYFVFHAPHGFFPVVNLGEPAMLYCFIFLYMAAAGPGPWSLDAARSKGPATA